MFGKFLEIKNLIADTFTSTHGSVEFELDKNDYGFITCETALIEQIARRVAMKINGIHNARVTVDKTARNLPLKVRFVLVLKQDFSANDVSARLSDDLKSYLKEKCGIVGVTIDVKINDVERVERKRRVK